MYYKLFVLSLLFLVLLSCNKPENKESESKSSFEKQDSGKVKTETLSDTITSLTKSLKENIKDTIPQQINKSGPDSLLAVKDKKRKADSLKSAKETDVKIQAYYFHPTARCVTCINIEKFSYEAVQQWEEKNKKKIVWNELNIDDSANEHYVDEYDLKFSSLVIVKYVGGKKDKWKNLEETWKLEKDKTSFIKYVINELDQFNKKN